MTKSCYHLKAGYSSESVINPLSATGQILSAQKKMLLRSGQVKATAEVAGA